MKAFRRYFPVYFTPGHWRYRCIEWRAAPMPGPAIHAAYARLRWGKGGLIRRVYLCWATSFWVLAALAAGLYLTVRLGAVGHRIAGKGYARQMAEQMKLFWQTGIFPDRYYILELFLDHRRPAAADYINRLEVKGGLYPLIKGAGGNQTRIDFGDKYAVHRQVMNHALSSVPIWALLRNGQFKTDDDDSPPQPVSMLEIPRQDLFLKPLDGKGGKGAERWQHGERDMYKHPATGRCLGVADLRDHMAALSQREPYLLQPCLSNHDGLKDLFLGGLMTVRMISIRNEAGTVEITDAALRMPFDAASSVDNFHAGGMASAIDIVDGVLGPASDMGLKTTTAWHVHHPATGGRIDGRILPLWPETVEFARHLHEKAFPERIFVGWDIAITNSGPVLIEANAAPGLDMMQRLPRSPLGQRRFGQLFAFHLRRIGA